jgi:urease accessory protein
VNGSLEVAVARGRITHLSSSPPISAKVLAGPTLLIVGSAAGLLEGDSVDIKVVLEPGCSLVVRTVAATLAHACWTGGETVLNAEVVAGEGARLAWLPEPLVAFAGCRHRSTARVDLADGAAAVWAETLALGRHGEAAGDVEVRLDVDRAGRPLLRDGLRSGPAAGAADGPAVLDGARHAGTVALLGLEAGDDDDGIVMALAGPGALARALATDAAALERRLGPARRAFLDRLSSPEAISNVA